MDREDEIIKLLGEIRDEIRANRDKWEAQQDETLRLTRESNETWAKYLATWEKYLSQNPAYYIVPSIIMAVLVAFYFAHVAGLFK